MSDEETLCTNKHAVKQHVRGLTPRKLEMIIHTMKDRRIHAAALQARGKLVRKDRNGRVMTVDLALEGQ